jgi:RNA polymerase sigma-70 factor, ECF subfamily
MKVDQNIDWSEIQKGNVKSFELLYYKFYKRLCLYTYSIVSDQYLTEEIVQELFIRLWQKKESIYITGSLKSYLFKAVHNESINAIKKKLSDKNSVNQILPEKQWQSIKDIMNYDAYILEQIEAQETETKINAAIELLPPQCKKIFKLSRINNLSTSEISIKLNISTHTIRRQLQNAIQKILQNLHFF